MLDVIPKILPKFIYPKRILELLDSKTNPPFEKKKPNWEEEKKSRMIAPKVSSKVGN
jgi:hypothetical protein